MAENHPVNRPDALLDPELKLDKMIIFIIVKWNRHILSTLSPDKIVTYMTFYAFAPVGSIVAGLCRMSDDNA